MQIFSKRTGLYLKRIKLKNTHKHAGNSSSLFRKQRCCCLCLCVYAWLRLRVLYTTHQAHRRHLQPQGNRIFFFYPNRSARSLRLTINLKLYFIYLTAVCVCSSAWTSCPNFWCNWKIVIFEGAICMFTIIEHNSRAWNIWQHLSKKCA